MKKLDIVYEDKDILIINKPAHLLTIVTDKERERTLYNEAKEYVKKQHKNNKIFIVHRLDKDTSGLVILAKNIKSKEILQNNWQNVKREYIAIVNGNLPNKKGILESYLNETKTHLVYSSKTGKKAITEYEVLKSNKLYSLIKINIKTGRKHQIRVQLNDINHPIVGDKIYSNIKNKANRLYLHAYYLEFIHPITNKLMEVKTKYPSEFNKFIP